jgi:hypothetical protein
MGRRILLLPLLLSACITVGDGGLEISGQVQKKDGGTLERCKLSVFYGDQLYEERQIMPNFSIYFVVPPTGQSARIDITRAGSDAVFSTTTDGSEKINLGEIAL